MCLLLTSGGDAPRSALHEAPAGDQRADAYDSDRLALRGEDQVQAPLVDHVPDGELARQVCIRYQCANDEMSRRPRFLCVGCLILVTWRKVANCSSCIRAGRSLRRWSIAFATSHANTAGATSNTLQGRGETVEREGSLRHRRRWCCCCRRDVRVHLLLAFLVMITAAAPADRASSSSVLTHAPHLGGRVWGSIYIAVLSSLEKKWQAERKTLCYTLFYWITKADVAGFLVFGNRGGDVDNDGMFVKYIGRSLSGEQQPCFFDANLCCSE